jgi:hypothetical protein
MLAQSTKILFQILLLQNWLEQRGGKLKVLHKYSFIFAVSGPPKKGFVVKMNLLDGEYFVFGRDKKIVDMFRSWEDFRQWVMDDCPEPANQIKKPTGPWS